MRCFIFFIICSFVVKLQGAPVTDSFAEDMKNRNQIALECMKQVGIERKVIERAMAVHENVDDLPTDNEYKEFLTCSYKKQKFQTEEGEMRYDKIVDFLARFYSRNDLKILEKCKNITAESDGEMAYNSLKCIINNIKTIEVTNNV